MKPNRPLESKSAFEVIPGNSGGPPGADRRFQGRLILDRLSLGSEQFKLTSSGLSNTASNLKPGQKMGQKMGKVFSITDLSLQGMGFWLLDPTDRQLFSVGLLLGGALNLKRDKYPVEARIRHLGIDRVGCEFENLSAEITTALHRFLDPYFLGSELKPIPSSERNTLWYHGPSGTDLHLVRSVDGQYEKLALYALGSCVQWDRTDGLSTAETRVSDHQCERQGIFKRETVFLVPDPTPDSIKLSIAKTVILGSNLPQDLKTWCIRRLEK